MPGRIPRKKTLSRKAQEALSSAPPSNTPPPPSSSFEYPPPPSEEDDPFDLAASKSPKANDSIEAGLPEILGSTAPEEPPEPEQNCKQEIRYHSRLFLSDNDDSVLLARPAPPSSVNRRHPTLH